MHSVPSSGPTTQIPGGGGGKAAGAPGNVNGPHGDGGGMMQSGPAEVDLSGLMESVVDSDEDDDEDDEVIVGSRVASH